MIVFRCEFNENTKIIYTDKMSIEDIAATMHYHEGVLGLIADTRRLFR